MSRPPWARLHPDRAGSHGLGPSEHEARSARCPPTPATRPLGVRPLRFVPAPPGAACGPRRTGPLPWRVGSGARPPARAAPRLPRPVVRPVVRVVERPFVQPDERVRVAPRSPEAGSGSARRSRVGGASAGVALFAGLLRTRCPAARRSADRSAIPLRCAGPPPVHAVRSVRPYVRPLVRPCTGCRLAARSRAGQGRTTCGRWRWLRLACLLVQPFVRPWPEAGSRWVGTPFVPTPSGGCGAQRRARAAPLGAGTGPARSHAQPPLGGEHGEHGEDPPLARSEHRGTPRARARMCALRFLLGFKCSGPFFQPISMCYPVDTRLLGRTSRLLGRTKRVYPDFWGASRLDVCKAGRIGLLA